MHEFSDFTQEELDALSEASSNIVHLLAIRAEDEQARARLLARLTSRELANMRLDAAWVIGVVNAALAERELQPGTEKEG